MTAADLENAKTRLIEMKGNELLIEHDPNLETRRAKFSADLNIAKYLISQSIAELDTQFRASGARGLRGAVVFVQSIGMNASATMIGSYDFISIEARLLATLWRTSQFFGLRYLLGASNFSFLDEDAPVTHR